MSRNRTRNAPRWKYPTYEDWSKAIYAEDPTFALYKIRDITEEAFDAARAEKPAKPLTFREFFLERNGLPFLGGDDQTTGMPTMFARWGDSFADFMDYIASTLTDMPEDGR